MKLRETIFCAESLHAFYVKLKLGVQILAPDIFQINLV